MQTLWFMAVTVIMFIALAVPGYIFGKTKSLDKHDSSKLSLIVLYIGMPFLFLSNLFKIDFNDDMLKNILICLIFSIASNVLVLLVGKMVGLIYDDKFKRGMFAFSTMASNGGFLGVPLAQTIFYDRPEVVLYVMIYMMVNNLLAWTLGVYEISRDAKNIKPLNIVFNPLMLSVYIGIIIIISGLLNYVPQIAQYCNILSGVVTPLSMIVLGLNFSQMKPSEIFSKGDMYLVSGLRLLFSPIFAVAFCVLVNLFLPISEEMILGVFITAAMPVAVASASYADKFGGDIESAVRYTLGSTILSIISLPILYYLLTEFLKVLF